MSGNHISDEIKAKALEENSNRGPKSPENPVNPPVMGPKSITKKKDKYVSKSLTPAEIQAMTPNFIGIGEKPTWLEPIKRAKWDYKLFRERHKLRKSLRKEFDMKLTRSEFETLATELGLGLQQTPFMFFPWLWTKIFGRGAIAWLLGLSVLGMSGFYAWSVIREEAGSFTVQINYNTMQDGFVLSETSDFAQKTGRLISTVVDKVNNITFSDIPKDIDMHDGSNNGLHYVAYSFYIKNDGDKVGSYEYVLSLTDSAKNADKAIWVMLFEDGHQSIYAKNSADGDEERLVGYTREPPFYDCAYDRDYQYYKTESGTWGIRTTPYMDETTVIEGIVRDVSPGEAHRYTVVLWLEGYDPECTDAIFDGYAKFTMEFNPIDEERYSIFSHLYRKEYEENPLTLD